MSTNAWIIVLSLAAVCIVGVIVFLMQYRTRRAMAMVALVITMFATFTLCAPTFLGSAFQIKPLGDKRDLGGFPFTVGTTWVYSRIGYVQTIGDSTRIITATQVYTDTVVKTEGNFPSLSFLQERTVSEISVPPGWWTSSVVNPEQNWYRINGNRILSVRYPDSQEGGLRYDFPLSAGKSWCPEPQPPVDPGCHSNGLRMVHNRIQYTTPVGTFDDCYEITEEFNSGGVNEWFCNGIGAVARKYDHAGTRFGFADTLVGFSMGSPPR